MKHPSESFEQEILVRYLDKNNYLYSATSNGQFLRSKAAQAKNKRQGVRRGLPDIIGVKDTTVFFLELKRKKGGRVSPEQKIWVEQLTACGVAVRVCAGADEAIKWIESL